MAVGTRLFVILQLASQWTLARDLPDLCCATGGTRLQCFNASHLTSAQLCAPTSKYSCYKSVNFQTPRSPDSLFVRDLHIGLLFPFVAGDPTGALAATKLALEIINSRSDILHGYRLVMHTERVNVVSTELPFSMKTLDVGTATLAHAKPRFISLSHTLY